MVSSLCTVTVAQLTWTLPHSPVLGPPWVSIQPSSILFMLVAAESCPLQALTIQSKTYRAGLWPLESKSSILAQAHLEYAHPRLWVLGTWTLLGPGWSLEQGSWPGCVHCIHQSWGEGTCQPRSR